MPVGGQHGRRVATTLASVFWALALACSGGGGGGGGGGGDAAPPPAPQTNVTLAWPNAAGPVAGYDVWVSRENGPWRVEKNVSSSSVTLTGAPGEAARLAVGAFDTTGYRGPVSVPSPTFYFPQPVTDDGSGGSGSDTAGTGSGSGGGSTGGSGSGGSGSGTGSTGGSGSGGSTGGAAPPTSVPVDPALLLGSVLWESGTVHRITNPWLVTLLVFPTPSQVGFVERGDLDGDGYDDLLWVDTAGQLSFTSLAALAADTATQPTAIGTLAAGEQVIGSGDVDGDGFDDVLVQGASGVVDAWLIGPGTQLVAIVTLGDGAGRTLLGVRDFDGNATDDVAWLASGVLDLWLTHPATPPSSLVVPIDANHEVIAVGDWDGDTASELALRDGAGNVLFQHPLSTTPLAVVDAALSAPAGWSVVGVADLDRNGTDDVVFSDGSSLRNAYFVAPEDVLALDPASPWLPLGLLR